MGRFFPFRNLLFVALFFMPTPSSASGAGSAVSPELLSLSAAIRTAVEKNPKVHASNAQVEAAESRIVQARSGLLPRIFAIETFNRTNNPMLAFGTLLNQEEVTREAFEPDRLNSPDAIDNFSTALGLDWSLFDGGKTWIGLQQAEQGHKAESLVMAKTKQEAIAETAVSYMALLLAQENLSVLEQSLETARAHSKMVGSRFESGLTVKSDWLRAQVHIADLEQQRLQAESRIKGNAAVLNAAMGVSVGTEVAPADRLEISNEIRGSLDEWIDRALKNRPDYKQIEIQEEIAEKEVGRSRAGHLPSLNLLGSYEVNTEDFGDLADSYQIGAVIRLNLYSGHRISSETKEAYALLRKTKALKRGLDSGVRVQVRQAFLQAQSAWGRIHVARAAVDQAEEALRITRNRYESGLLAIVGLLDAEVALRQVRMNHFQALHDYKVAHALLELAAGTIDIDFQ